MARHSVSSVERPPASVGVVVIGAGFIAEHHLTAVRSSSRAHVVGVVDVDAGRAEALARSAGDVAWTSDLTEALSWPGVDACIVCTPNHTHEAIGVAVASAGKHLLIEKPLATTVGAAENVVAAFTAAGTTVMAAHTHRFYDYARGVAEAVRDGAVGRPMLARISLLGGWIWPDWRAWMLDPEKSGGHALHNGVHLLDLVCWWIGDEPTRVHARGRAQTAAELEIFDYLEMTVDFAGGASAICEMSRAHRPVSIDRRDVLIVGTGGVLALPWEQWGATLVRESGTTTLQPQAGNGFAVQFDGFLDAVAGSEAAMTAADGVRAVALGVAAEESIRAGRPVDLRRPAMTGEPA